jgi:hypothetical protein
LWECGKLIEMKSMFGDSVDENGIVLNCRHMSRVFQGIVENSFRKRPRRQRRERAGKEFSKRLWENGGNPIGDPSAP